MIVLAQLLVGRHHFRLRADKSELYCPVSASWSPTAANPLNQCRACSHPLEPVFIRNKHRCALAQDIVCWAKVEGATQGAKRHAWVMSPTLGRLVPLCGPGRGPHGPNAKLAIKKPSGKVCGECFEGAALAEPQAVPTAGSQPAIGLAIARATPHVA